MSSSNFEQSERVEALWPDDGTWHPAKVLKVKGNGVYLIQFVGWVEKYDFRADQLRTASVWGSSAAASNRNISSPAKGSAKAVGGAQRAPSKVRQPQDAAPAPATAPTFTAPTSGLQLDAQRLFEAFLASVQRPSSAADYYAALEVAADARQEEISQQLRKKSLKWHADKTQTHAESLVPADTAKRSEVVNLVATMLVPVHEEENRFLNEVKDALTDTHKRADYDSKQASSKLDGNLSKLFESGASGTFTFNGKDFVRSEARSIRTPKRSKAGIQPEQSQAAATIAHLQDQVQRLIGELLSTQTAAHNESARVAAAAAEKEAQHREELKREAELKSRLQKEVEQLKTEMRQEQSQAAATIAHLQDQVQRLTGELRFFQRTVQEFQVSFNAGIASWTERSNAAIAEVCIALVF